MVISGGRLSDILQTVHPLWIYPIRLVLSFCKNTFLVVLTFFNIFISKVRLFVICECSVSIQWLLHSEILALNELLPHFVTDVKNIILCWQLFLNRAFMLLYPIYWAAAFVCYNVSQVKKKEVNWLVVILLLLFCFFQGGCLQWIQTMACCASGLSVLRIFHLYLWTLFSLVRGPVPEVCVKFVDVAVNFRNAHFHHKVLF